ncbi:MAG: VCBS repeat-containing protein [Chloroflexota bacterium]|nr:VCBS repeat-containing protein [Chloroflexota bacterium]
MKQAISVGKIGTLLMVLLVVVSTGIARNEASTIARAAPQETIISLSGERIRNSGLAAADFNGDGYKEIVAGGVDGVLYVISTSNGTSWSTVWSHQVNTEIEAANPPTSRSTNEIHSSPIIADLDGNGKLDIVVAVGGSIYYSNQADRHNGGVLVYEYNSPWSFSLIEQISGDGAKGWPQPRIDAAGDETQGYGQPDGLWDGFQTTPAVGDLDGDGDLEIVISHDDRRIHAWHHDGSKVAGWPIYRYNGDNLLRGGLSSPALGDIDGDNLPEVIVGTMSPPWDGEHAPDYSKATLWAINGDSTNVNGFPVTTEQVIHSSPALGDIDGDGQLEIVVGVGWGTDGRENIVYAWNHDGTLLSNWPRVTDSVMKAPPALGDIDGDGVLEVVIGSGRHYSCSTGKRLWAWNADGSSVSGFPVEPPSPNSWISGSYDMPYDPILADIDGDSDIEIIIAHHGAYGITIVESDSPSTSEQRFIADLHGLEASPMVDDVDNDGKLEILAGGGDTNGIIVIWDENGAGSSARPWPMFRHNVQRTGNVYFGDTTPPQNPSVTSSTHTQAVWSNNNVVQVSWSGDSDDESGIAGYYYTWSTSPTTVVDASDSRLAPNVSTLTSSPLSDAPEWYFQLRAVDLAGNLADETVHLGPFRIDTTPPTSALTAPPCAVLSATVSWQGWDHGSGVADYDIEVRAGSSGSWTNWKSGTTDTSAAYMGSADHTYQFRSRARDAAGNLEAIHTDADAQTWVAQYGFSGSAYNTLGQPIFAAQVTSAPTGPMVSRTDLQGNYLLCYNDPLTYALAVSHSGFGSLPAMQHLSGSTTGLDFYLPPADNLVSDGDFELGGTAWATSGPVTPVLTTTAHTGNGALRLFTAGTTGISQSLTLPAPDDPLVLSWMYQYQAQGASAYVDRLTVMVIGESATINQDLSLDAPAWIHGTLDVSAMAGQDVTLYFGLESPLPGTLLPPAAVLFDEISLGQVAPGVLQVFLPLVTRQA